MVFRSASKYCSAVLVLLAASAWGVIIGPTRAVMENTPATNSAIYVSTGTSAATSRVTVQNLTVQQLTANQCVQTTAGGVITTTGFSCGTSVAVSSTAFTIFNGSTLVVSSPSIINFDSSTFLASLVGISTASVKLVPSTVTLQGNTFNAANKLVLLNGSSQYPALDGSLITNLSAANLTGTISSTTLAASVILNRNTLQPGATFFVSSGTVDQVFNLNGSSITNTNATHPIVFYSPGYDGWQFNGPVDGAGNSGFLMTSQGITLKNVVVGPPATGFFSFGSGAGLGAFRGVMGNVTGLCSDLSTPCTINPVWVSTGSSYGADQSVTFDATGKLMVGSIKHKEAKLQVGGSLLVGTGYSDVSGMPTNGMLVNGASIFKSSITVDNTAATSVDAAVITTSGTGTGLTVRALGFVSNGYQNRKGIATIGDDLTTHPFSTHLVLVDSTTDPQFGGGMFEIFSDNPLHNDPKLWFHVAGHDSSPEIRDDAGAPNWEMIATGSDTARGLGKFEPAAVAWQGIDLQINSRAWNNGTFETMGYWHPLSQIGSGLYIQAQTLTDDSGVLTSSDTSGTYYQTLNNHTVGITAPLNPTATWVFALPSTFNNLGQVLYQSDNGRGKNNNARSWDFTTGGSTGNCLQYNAGAAPTWGSCGAGGGVTSGSTTTWTAPQTYQSSSTFLATVAISTGLVVNSSAGASGQYLKSNGSAAIPTWAWGHLVQAPVVCSTQAATATTTSSSYQPDVFDCKITPQVAGSTVVVTLTRTYRTDNGSLSTCGVTIKRDDGSTNTDLGINSQPLNFNNVAFTGVVDIMASVQAFDLTTAAGTQYKYRPYFKSSDNTTTVRAGWADDSAIMTLMEFHQ